MKNLLSRRRLLALSAMTLSLGTQASTSVPEQSDTVLHSQLQRVAGLRIFLGHQSVGANLLEGLKQLANKTDVPLHIAELQSAQALPAATFGHIYVAENRNPIGKLQAFDTAMGTGTELDIAMVKFCFLDFESDTNVQALFTRYQNTVNTVRARNPKVTIVHITVPLTTVQTGTMVFLKSLLGKAPYGVLENQRREEFSALLRQTYRGREPIFDLAHIESTAPDGSASTESWKGTSFPVLTAAYTDDGSHLNKRGQLLAARQLVTLLANVSTH